MRCALRCGAIACLVAAGLGIVPAGPAEAVEPGGGGTTPQLLDAAVARGEIDRETADLHLAEVFAGRGRSTRVPARFQSDLPWDGTMPLLRLTERSRARSAGPAKARTEAALAAVSTCDGPAASTGTLPNETTSTHFYVAYGTIGGGLSVASYLTSLEAAYGTQVTSFGWAAPPALGSPPPPPIGTRYPVRIEAFSGGLYGYVSSSGTGAGFVGNNPNTYWDDEDALATCMVLNRDFGAFPGTPQQALDATVAHELNHSIQYGYGAPLGSNVPDDVFFEGGATWMEDEVFDGANDNYGYLWPDLRESLGDYDREGYPAPYDMWIVFRGMTERFGTGVAGGGEQVMQDFWESTSQGTGTGLGALAIGLANKGVALPDAYHDLAIAAGFMRTCGAGYGRPHCFEEAAGYVARAGLPTMAGSIGSVGAGFMGEVEDDYALNWVELPTSGSYTLTLANSSSGGQLRLTAVCDTGTNLVRSPMPAGLVGGGVTKSLTGFNAGGCVRAIAVITNQQQSAGDPDASAARSYTLSTGAPGPNQPPAANGDTYSTFEGTPLTVAAPGVLGNDTDPNGHALTATAAGHLNGTVALSASGAFTFTPTAGFTGAAGFSYTASDGRGGTDAAAVAVTVKPRPTYAPLTPARLLDTRLGATTADGVSAAGGALAPGTTRTLQVTGRGGVPAVPVAAVALNVTAVAPTAGGFLTVFPTGEDRPLASNLNVRPGQTIPNLVVAKVGAGGQVSIYNATGSTHVIADVAGWYPVTPGYSPLTPTRLMDTRAGAATIDGTSAAGGAVAAGGTRQLQVTGRGGVPPSGVGAVVLNVTAVAPSANGFLTVFPAGEARRLASTVNFGPGQTIPNLVLAKVGAGGQVSVYNATGSTHVVVDVAGWFPSGSAYTALSPGRLLDTRPGALTADGIGAGGGAVAAGSTRTLQVAGRGGVPATGVGAVALNVTAVTPTAGGFLTVFPTGELRPLASNLNFEPGQIIANLVLAKVGSSGQVSIYNVAGSTHVIADVAGWFPAVP